MIHFVEVIYVTVIVFDRNHSVMEFITFWHHCVIFVRKLTVRFDNFFSPISSNSVVKVQVRCSAQNELNKKNEKLPAIINCDASDSQRRKRSHY